MTSCLSRYWLEFGGHYKFTRKKVNSSGQVLTDEESITAFVAVDGDDPSRVALVYTSDRFGQNASHSGLHPLWDQLSSWVKVGSSWGDVPVPTWWCDSTMAETWKKWATNRTMFNMGVGPADMHENVMPRKYLGNRRFHVGDHVFLPSGLSLYVCQVWVVGWINEDPAVTLLDFQNGRKSDWILESKLEKAPANWKDIHRAKGLKCSVGDVVDKPTAPLPVAPPKKPTWEEYIKSEQAVAAMQGAIDRDAYIRRARADLDRPCKPKYTAALITGDLGGNPWSRR